MNYKCELIINRHITYYTKNYDCQEIDIFNWDKSSTEIEIIRIKGKHLYWRINILKWDKSSTHMSTKIFSYIIYG